MPRDYAGRIGASWTFATADPQTLAAFWKPFDVVLSTSDVHRSTLALIDRHGYIRTYFFGAPDVGGTLPAPLDTQLSAAGRQLLLTHGNGWGDSQILDALRDRMGVEQRPAEAGEGMVHGYRFILSGARTRAESKGPAARGGEPSCPRTTPRLK